MSEFRCSDKQIAIMKLVVEAAARGRFITIAELRAELPHKPGRSAIHSSLSFLRKHGYLDTINHGRNGGDVVPTPAGISVFKAKPTL